MNRPFFFNSRFRLLSIVGILLFAGAGAYIIFVASAAEDPQSNILNPGAVYFGGDNMRQERANSYQVFNDTLSRPLNSPFDVIVTANIPNASFNARTYRAPDYPPPTMSKLHLYVLMQAIPNHPNPQVPLWYDGFTCASQFSCQVKMDARDRQGNPDWAQAHLFSIWCVDIPEGMFNTKNVPILTARYKPVIQDDYSLLLIANWWAGTCAETQAAFPYMGHGVVHGSGSSQREARGKVGPGGITPDNSGNRNSGSGRDGSGLGPGGGGGSSANRQGDDPNSVPSSSSRGEADNPELEPDPFFDGTRYKKGSDADTLANTVASTGRKLVRTWPIALVVLVLGGAAGYGYWRWRKYTK